MSFIYFCTVNNTPNLTNRLFLKNRTQPTNKPLRFEEHQNGLTKNLKKPSHFYGDIFSDLVVQGSSPCANFITANFTTVIFQKKSIICLMRILSYFVAFSEKLNFTIKVTSMIQSQSCEIADCRGHENKNAH